MFTADRLRPLSDEECRRLLTRSQHHVGRIGYDDGQPTILPVNYVLDGERIVIRSAAGSKLDAAVSGRTVAFEIDSASSTEPRQAHAWSVLVRGPARVVTEADEVNFLRLSQLEPDAGGLKPHYIVIEIQQLTGRRY